MLLELFITFLTIGFISFGGGYAILPVIEREVTRHGWMTTQEFIDVIAVAGMSPGPIATNTSIFVGYNTAGVPGAVVSTLGMAFPSFLIVVLVALFFYKVHKSKLVKSAFYGLRPIITALIIYGAYRFAKSNGLIGPLSVEMLIPLTIFVVSLVALLRFKLHPFYTIVMSGIAGVIIYV